MNPQYRVPTLLLALPLSTALAGCGDDLTLPGQGPAATVEIVRGDSQSAEPGAALPESVVVRVTDDRGRPAVGRRVEWIVDDGDGKVSSAVVTTDSGGYAAVQWVLGPVTGEHALRTVVPYAGWVVFHAHAAAKPASGGDSSPGDGGGGGSDEGGDDAGGDEDRGGGRGGGHHDDGHDDRHDDRDDGRG
jgi:hypothetical protein